MKSLRISLVSQLVTECDSSVLSVPFSNSLSILRGGTFFTSAYSLPSGSGAAVFLKDRHYDRLVDCYALLYSRLDFPLTRVVFESYLDRLLAINPLSKETQMQILVLVLGGGAMSQGHEEWSFLNGFEGDVSEILFIAQPMSVKPKWSFKYGINVRTLVYQRPTAQAKPAVYKGGIEGQWEMTCRNVYWMLSDYYSMAVDGDALEWDVVDSAEKCRLRCLSREVKAGNIDFLRSYSFQSSYFETIINKWLSDETRPLISELEMTYMRDIDHDVVFTSSDGGLLEGSTFSLLGLDAQLQWVFIPLESRHGVILESTTVYFIKAALKAASILYSERSVSLDELPGFKGLFAVSSTRLSIQKDHIHLQRIRRVNGVDIGDDGDGCVSELSCYRQLTEALSCWMAGYLGSSIVN
jgi:hypothetical protein